MRLGISGSLFGPPPLFALFAFTGSTCPCQAVEATMFLVGAKHPFPQTPGGYLEGYLRLQGTPGAT